MIENILLIMQQEIKATLRRKFFIIFAFGFPLITGLVAVILYQVNNNQPPPLETPAENAEAIIPEGFVDYSGIIQAGYDSHMGGFIRFSEELFARNALDAEEIKGYFVIPADYLKSGRLEYFSLENNVLNIRPNSYGMATLLAINLAQDRPETWERLVVPMEVFLHAKAPESSADLQDNWFASRLTMFMVVLLYIVILIPASNLVSGLLDEKKNRVMEILLSSVSPMQLFVGKLAATGILGLLQTLLWITVMWGVATFGGQPLNLPEGYKIPMDLLAWGIVFATLGFMMYGAQLAGVGAIAPDLNESRSVTILVMLPLIVGYSLTMVIEEAPFGVLAYVLSFFPLTAPVVMIGRLAVTDIPLWEPVVSALLQGLAVWWLVRTFGRLFHARLMLSGQPLTVKRLFTALRTG